MGVVETLSTAGIPRHRQMEYWNKIACRNISQETVVPVSRSDFWGCMRSGQLGRIRIVEVSSDPARVTCSGARSDGSRAPEYLLHVQLEGESNISQGGRQATLYPGDSTLCNASLPRNVYFPYRTSMLIFCIPSDLLRRRIALPEIVALGNLSAANESTAVAINCLRNIWHGCTHIGPKLVPRFADILVDLVGAALAPQPELSAAKSSVLPRTRIEMLNFIESRLTDSTLTARVVASRFGISVRHAYSVFGPKESVTKYILRRRLEESARILTDPAYRCRSVGRIADDHGFSSLSQFCTVFRRHYGVPPGEYRLANGRNVLTHRSPLASRR